MIPYDGETMHEADPVERCWGDRSSDGVECMAPATSSLGLCSACLARHRDGQR